MLNASQELINILKPFSGEVLFPFGESKEVILPEDFIDKNMASFIVYTDVAPPDGTLKIYGSNNGTIGWNLIANCDITIDDTVSPSIFYDNGYRFFKLIYTKATGGVGVATLNYFGR